MTPTQPHNDESADETQHEHQAELNKANSILRKKQTKVQLVKHLHDVCLCPAASTFIKAINNNHFFSFPGLTADLVRHNLLKSVAVLHGHLKLQRQGLQSTKAHIVQNESQTDESKDFFPQPEEPNVRTNQSCYALIDASDESTAFVDLTGCFPKRSSRANEHAFAGHHFDENCMLGAPTKNRRGETIVSAWKNRHYAFTKAGSAP